MIACSVLTGNGFGAEKKLIAVRTTEQAIEVESHASRTWKIKLDLKQGGVATALHLPASAPNLIADAGGFTGLFNAFACDARPGQPGAGPDGGFAKTLLKNKSTAVSSAQVLSDSGREAVVEIRGETTGWRIAGPKDEKVLRYRQTYTFRPDRVIVDGEWRWVYGYDSSPVEMNVLTYFAEGVVNPPARILKPDGYRIPLAVQSSGGGPFPDGFNHPITVEVALKNGERLLFRSVTVPELWTNCPLFKYERPWQTQWMQQFGFSGYCKPQRYPANKPIAYRYELEFAGPFADNKPPLVTIISPQRRRDKADEDGVYSGQFFKPGEVVKLVGAAKDPEDGELGPLSLYWQIYRASYIPFGAGAGQEFALRIPANMAKGTVFWVRLSGTDSKGMTSEDYVTFGVAP